MEGKGRRRDFELRGIEIQGEGLRSLHGGREVLRRSGNIRCTFCYTVNLTSSPDPSAVAFAEALLAPGPPSLGLQGLRGALVPRARCERGDVLFCRLAES